MTVQEWLECTDPRPMPYYPGTEVRHKESGKPGGKVPGQRCIPTSPHPQAPQRVLCILCVLCTPRASGDALRLPPMGADEGFEGF